MMYRFQTLLSNSTCAATTGQVSKHFDTWDSIEKQGYLNGPEGVAEVVKQVRPAPAGVVLRLFAHFQVLVTC